MKLSIIILNYKTKGLLKQCLKGIKSFKLPFDYETIVVDNNSKDSSCQMIKEEFPYVKLIALEKNKGFAGGMNEGIKKAQGNYLLLMNPDIAILNNAIEKMIEFLEKHPQVALVAPKLINPDGSVQTSCRRFPDIWVLIARRSPLGKVPYFKKKIKKFLMLDWDHKENRPVDWVLGACMLVRRKAIEEVGLLDERFFLYLEDVDWCRRFWEKGWQVYYLADTEMVHYHQRLSALNPGLRGIFSYATRIHIKSAIKYFLKYWRKNET